MSRVWEFWPHRGLAGTTVLGRGLDGEPGRQGDPGWRMLVLPGYSVDLMQEPRGRGRRCIWPAGQATRQKTVSLSTEEALRART